MTLSSDINTTSTALKNIKDAINNKGGSATGSITTYPNAISNIVLPSGIPREVSAQGIYEMPTTNFTFSLPNNVVDIGNYALRSALNYSTGLISVDLSSVLTISGTNALNLAFNSCTNLISVDLSALRSISGSSALGGAFFGCTGLDNKSISFPALTSTGFGSYTNQFTLMLSGVTGCTVHFPSNLQSVIGNWSSVTAGFSGTNTTVLFDLPATT